MKSIEDGQPTVENKTTSLSVDNLNWSKDRALKSCVVVAGNNACGIGFV